MDDLEKAILISFDESGTVDSVLKSQAIEYCQRFKESSNICSICVERLFTSKIVLVQFWCLQCLHDAIRVRYASLMSPEEKGFVRKSVFAMACYEGIDDNNAKLGSNVVVRILDSPVFIKNKLAQVLVTLISFEYPMIWSNVFVDFLPCLNKGPVVIDMFCRVLNALDDQIISLDYIRNADEVALAARVKDAMRQQCVHQIVGAWFEIVNVYKSSDPELCTSVLDCMRRYISWIDINLVVDYYQFVPLFFELVLLDGLSEQLRGAAARCVLAVAQKRMEPQNKLKLLQSLHIRRVFGVVSEDADSEVVANVAILVTGYAVEVLECVRRLNPEEGKRVSTELLEEVLPSVFYVMQKCEMDASFSVVQFLSGYVATMKNTSLSEKQLLHVGQILEVIRAQICYDPFYRDHLDVLDKVGQEEEERMVEYRKDLLVLLRSVGRVAPVVTQMFIRNSLVSASSSPPDRNVEEVEVALSLLYALGESLSDDLMRSGGGVLGELIPMLLSTRFPCHSYRLVALTYLETITRYIKHVQENTQCIPVALTAFLDERGIHHPNFNVSRRASYLFMRVVKLLRSKLIPFIETILQSLQDVVARFTNMSYAEGTSSSEDGSHIFEAIGILIGMEEMPVEKQTNYLSSLLTPLCQQVEGLLVNGKVQNPNDYLKNTLIIQQIIMAINALSKGFSERLVTASRPEIGLMFKQTLDVLLQVLIVFPKEESLRSKVTSFVHRMVETLGGSVFPYLPKALEQLLLGIEPKELVGIIVLLNQLICKFNVAVHDILDDVFPAITREVFAVVPTDAFPSGPGTNTEEIRERQELQRTFYTFLNVIATHDLSSVFLSSKSRAYLDSIMQLLLNSCANHKDITVRKVPGFQTFIVETFATNCCLYSVLDKSFDFQDANTLALFGEIITVQKVMYEKFGENFVAQFVSKGFLAAHCPPDLAQQYHQKLQGFVFYVHSHSVFRPQNMRCKFPEAVIP
ncbi:hypothetical protein KSS87_008175 [Heliosperma pusillum]|nr:hypothetical protein KSS87_008175 [Heliosperma pusillum]